MNYINRLERDLDRSRNEVTTLQEGITDLMVYLTSDKFSQDPTVQVRDVLARLTEMRSAIR